MEGRSITLLQIQALKQELCTIEKCLGNEKTSENFRRFRDRVKPSFSRAIKKLRQNLDDIKEQVEEHEMPLAMAWSKFRETQRDCHLLFAEFLAFIEGALSREASVDNGLCGIADGLLDELSGNCGIRWGLFTILAEGEFFHDLAGIIRLRFPDVTIWNLPVAVHEFGHFVAQELHLRQPGGAKHYPFQQMLTDDGKGEVEKAFLHEYFADLFATYSLGPAYAYTCIYLRFNPLMSDSDRHPSAAKRVYLVLKTLELMGKRGDMQQYFSVIEPLTKHWQTSLAAVGQPESLDEATVKQLDQCHIRMYAILNDSLPDSGKYQGWAGAQKLAATFHQVTPEDHTLADVLNAAWLRRLSEWEQSPTISDQALRLCHEIIRKRQQRELERLASGR
jgi:hypothetical protein